MLEEAGFELPVPRTDVVSLWTQASEDWRALLLVREMLHSDIDLNERSEREQAVAQDRVVAQFGGGAGVADAALLENVDAVSEGQ